MNVSFQREFIISVSANILLEIKKKEDEMKLYRIFYSDIPLKGSAEILVSNVWATENHKSKPDPHGRVVIPLTCLTPPRFCVCPKQGPGFPTSYNMVFPFFVFSELR